MKRKCREGNRRERELTRLILGAILLGAGTLGAPRAEAKEYVINSYPSLPDGMQEDPGNRSIFPALGAAEDIVKIDCNYRWTESNSHLRSFYGGYGSGEISPIS